MNLPPVLRQQFFDGNGNPLAGGKVYTYQSGTLTPQATYTDNSGSTANANPIILDASGVCSMWLDPTLSYKFVMKDSSDVQVDTKDGVVGTNAANSVSTGSLQDGAVTAPKLAPTSISGQTEKFVPSTADSALLFDSSVSLLKKVTLDHMAKLITPSGSVMAYAGTIEPSGWLMCDGRPVSRSTYADLFSAIGTAHGDGTKLADGTTASGFTAGTYFNLPDYRGRFLRGISTDSARDPDNATRIAQNVGGNAGGLVGSVQADENKPHNHGVTDPTHTHGYTIGNTDTGSAGGGGGGGWSIDQGAATTGASATGITINNSTGAESRPKNVAVNWIIRQ